MGKNMLTTKEATLLSDMLIYEESACKKAQGTSQEFHQRKTKK